VGSYCNFMTLNLRARGNLFYSKSLGNFSKKKNLKNLLFGDQFNPKLLIHRIIDTRENTILNYTMLSITHFVGSP